MQPGHPACPFCRHNLFVRAECIISGRRIAQAFYCGRCEHEWRVQEPHLPERRVSDRDRRRVARASLKPPAADRQKAV